MKEFYLKKGYPLDIIEYAFEQYPEEWSEVRDCDSGCVLDCEDINARARHHFIQGAIWERNTNKTK